MKPEDIIAIMASESGINPAIPNQAGATAIGLIQFTPGTLKGLGYDKNWKEFGNVPAVEQLDYVKRYIQSQEKVNGGPLKSAAHFYVATFWPVALKLPGIRQGNSDTVFVEENPQTVTVGGSKYSKKYYDIGFKINPQMESRAYKENRLFHGNIPGVITFGDMQAQVERTKRGTAYRNAVATMKNTTNYAPSSIRPVEVANNNNPNVLQNYLDRFKGKPSMTSRPTSQVSNVNQILNNYLQLVMASDKPNKKLYNKLLPNHNILISVASKNYNDAIEFSRILSTALDIELLAKSYVHTDGESVDIECTIAGPSMACLDAVKELSTAVASAFKDATIKIGGIEIQTKCSINKKSSYQPISFKQADINYRTFLLKFI
jgi:hypothetical protein